MNGSKLLNISLLRLKYLVCHTTWFIIVIFCIKKATFENILNLFYLAQILKCILLYWRDDLGIFFNFFFSMGYSSNFMTFISKFSFFMVLIQHIVAHWNEIFILYHMVVYQYRLTTSTNLRGKKKKKPYIPFPIVSFC